MEMVKGNKPTYYREQKLQFSIKQDSVGPKSRTDAPETSRTIGESDPEPAMYRQFLEGHNVLSVRPAPEPADARRLLGDRSWLSGSLRVRV